MKSISKKAKIIALIVAIIIIAGVVVTLTIGFSFDLRYQEAKEIQLYIEKEFNISDIKQITNEVLGNQSVIIRKVEVYEDSVNIIAKEITDEQKTNIINKVNEKYGTQLSADTTQVTTVTRTRGRDIIKPYIFPLIIATVIILVYMAIRYYKLGILKTLVKTFITLVLAQAILWSLMAIVRLPIGRLTIPLMLVIYVLSLLGLTSNFEKKLLEKKKEEEK